MKKIKILFIIFILLFSFKIEAFAENKVKTSSWALEEQSDKSLSDFILKRKDKIEEILKNSDNSLEKKQKDISQNIESKKNNAEISWEVVEKLQKQFEELNKSIAEKNKEIEDLKEKDSLKAKNEIYSLKEKKQELEKKINLEKEKILWLQSEIAELEIYKKRYDKLINDEKIEKLKDREKNLLIYFWILLVYLIISWFWLRIKNIQKKSIYNVFSTIIFITSIVLFTLVINPWFVIIFIIIAWSMVLAFKDFIVSLIASILILRKYKIWDLVEIEGRKWKINSISAFNTTLLTNSGEIFLLNNFLISKPLKLVEKDEQTLKLLFVVEKNNLKEKLNKIKNVFKNDEINYNLMELEDNKIEIELEINWVNVNEKIEKIF